MIKKPFIGLLFYVCSHGAAYPQQTAKVIYTEGPVIGYLEYLPPGYHSESKDYPVIIFLHGGGSGGNGSPGELEKLKSAGPPSHIRNGNNMCFTAGEQEECFIVISPQLIPELFEWEPYYVDLVVEHVLSGPDEYKADPSRIYLTGYSRGGHGVYLYANGFSSKLAAIAPVAAWSETYVDGCEISAKKLPVWAFHGSSDTVVPYADGIAAFNSIKNCSDPAPEAEMIFTTYQDWYHDSWIPAYDPSHTYHTPNLYEWLLLHRREGDTSAVVDGMPQRQNQVFTIYPNPAEDYFYLSFFKQVQPPASVIIRNINGNKIQEVAPGSQYIDASDLPPGIYIVQLTNSLGVTTSRRLIKM